jgi:recombinational DNA repair protein (RecF pathway)
MSDTPKCSRCGGTDDLKDRAFAPGLTYCAACRRALAEEEAAEAAAASQRYKDELAEIGHKAIHAHYKSRCGQRADSPECPFMELSRDVLLALIEEGGI